MSANDRFALRREFRQRRRALSPTQRIAAAAALAERLLALSFAPTQGYAAGYWAMDGEIALHAWQTALPANVVYCLPVLDEERQRLRFAPWRFGEPLSSNRYGIPEPVVEEHSLIDAQAMRFIAMPLVAFDLRRHRLGMGGGWYDRTFEFRRNAPAPPWLVGVGFSLQQTDALAAEPWDVAPDAICTDETSYFDSKPAA